MVTHHRLEADGKGGLQPAPSSKLEEPFVIRPTSETIIGDAMSRWVQSYRDLPLKLNQWCNVMRWEMRTRMFLRTSEFLWQEGHNAFETANDAREDALKMLDAYEDFAQNTLAIPVIKGEKTPEERFPGADMTYTIEAMMQDGKALQAGTSHDLGQNFAKSCGIKFQGRSGNEEYAYTTSWGISTRLIGALIMTHADDDGMIMPPRIAPHHVLIIPIVRDGQDSEALLNYTRDLATKLKSQNIRAHIDASDERTPNKMWGAIKKGVPIRVEIGGREMEEGTLTYIRRDLGKDSKKTVKIDEFVNDVCGVLDEMHDGLFERAKKFRDANIHEVKDLVGLEKFFKDGKAGFIKMDAVLATGAQYEKIKQENGLTARCMPLAEPGKILIAKAY